MASRYIPPISEAGLAQPGHLEGVTLYLFVVPASPARLTQHLTRTFEIPTAGMVTCKPIGDFVVLACTSIDWLVEADRSRGHIRYNDIAFWIPATLRSPGERARRVFHPATIIVDQPHTMVTGRETFGLVKEMGWFEMPASPERVDQVCADVWGTPQAGIEQRMRRCRLFELRRIAEGPTRKLRLEALALEALPLLTGLLDHGPAFARTTHVLGLRQLRDPADPTRASHQSIVTAPLVMTRLHGSGPLAGAYELDLHDLHSHPLADRLGLQIGLQPVRAAAWIRADVRMDPGKVVWSRDATTIATPPAARRRKVVILGGGMAGLATALTLSEPELGDHFEITIYQRGWRLGGKGASGRNARAHQRTEEHGLHVWYGFYDNAFALLRRAYDELARPAGHRFARLEDAFTAQRYVVANERHGDEWTRWRMHFDDNGLSPGGPLRMNDFWSLADQTLGWFSTLFSLLAEHRPTADERERGFADRLLAGLAEPGAKLAAMPIAAAFEAVRELTRRLAERREGADDRDPLAIHRRLAALLEQLRAAIWPRVATRLENAEVRMFWSVFDAALTVYIGCVRDRLCERGLSSVDDEDLRTWLLRHGAQPHPTVDQSPLVRFIYDAGFAFEHGDPRRPNFAAGAALRGILRFLLSFKGALLYEMNAGMGDVVFAPIYEVLRRRGVRIELFHDARALRLGPPSGSGELHVASIELLEQAPTHEGRRYRPLVEIEGVPCWPSEPDWQQLHEGEQLAALLADEGRNLEQLGCPPAAWPHARRFELLRGRDFDDVVLAIPPSAQASLAAELRERSPRYDTMLRHAASVATQGYQVWFAPDLAGLGWTEPTPIFGTYVDPVNTWADLSHLLAVEQWPTGHVGSLAYLCGVMRDPEGADERTRQHAGEREVADALHHYLEDHGGYMWPALMRADGSVDASLIRDQYTKANVEGSDRYVQTPAGSTRFRLRSDQSGVENLFLAGDWTDNGLNSGCIEAAVMSGLQAARALAGHDVEVIGETDGWLSELFGLEGPSNCYRPRRRRIDDERAD